MATIPTEAIRARSRRRSRESRPIGEYIRYVVLTLSGLSEKHAAERLGVELSALVAILDGHIDPSISLLRQIGALTNSELGDLMVAYQRASLVARRCGANDNQAA